VDTSTPPPTNPPPLDLNTLARVGRYELSVKSLEDPEDARHRRRKDLLLLSVALLGLCAIGFFCVWVLMSPSASADDKKWAQSVLTAIVAGLIGYLTGRGTT
jgi:hypothetical protein